MLAKTQRSLPVNMNQQIMEEFERSFCRLAAVGEELDCERATCLAPVCGSLCYPRLSRAIACEGIDNDKGP